MMKMDTEVDGTALQTRLNRLENIVMAALIVLLLFLGAAAFITTVGIGNFERIFSEMLGAKPLPILTQWVISWGRFSFGIPFSFLLPLGAVVFLFVGKSRSIAWWTALIVILFLCLYLLIVNLALYLPMISIITEMNHQG